MLPKIIIIMIILFSGISQAFASPAEPAPAEDQVTLNDLQNAGTRHNDLSFKALRMVFGSAVDNPLNPQAYAGDESVLTAVFYTLNSILFAVGGIFVLWAALRAIFKGGETGDVKKSLSIWTVSRPLVGVMILFPTPNGWCFSQLLMIWLSLTGIGAANITTDAAVDAFAEGKTMIVEPASPETQQLARDIFLIDLCWTATNADWDRLAAMGGHVDPDWKQTGSNLPANNGFKVEAAEGNKSCGSAYIDEERLQAQMQPSWSLFSDIDTSAVYEAHKKALMKMQASLMNGATAYFTAYLNSKSQPTTLPKPQIYIEQAAREYEATIMQSVKGRDGDLDSLSVELKDSMKQNGWWMLGGWYQTFAKANQKIADSVNAQIIVEGESYPQYRRQLYEEVLHAFETSMSDLPASSPLASSDRVTEQKPDSAFSKILSAPGKSLLQGIVSMDYDYGSDTTSPVIRLKNLGDVILNTANGIVIAHITAATATSATNFVPFVGEKISKFATGLLRITTPYIFTVVLALMMIGIGFATYIPLIPFIIWFSAAINWMVIIVEAVVAAPLWALAHLVSDDSEGLGAFTKHGYLFIMNVLFRPLFMVIGFFFAAVLVEVGGDLLNSMFPTVIDNAQYNSLTGFVTIIGFLFVYLTICTNLLHSAFNVIFILPDQALPWIGGHVASALGRDINDRTKSGNIYAGAKMENTAEKLHNNFKGRNKGSSVDNNKDGIKE